MSSRYVTVLHSPDDSLITSQIPLVTGGKGLWLGRQPAEVKGRTVCISDKQLSRNHLHIRMGDDGCVVIRDLNSRNGTRWERTKLSGEATIWSDAVLKLGETVIHVGHEPLTIEDCSSVIDPTIRDVARRYANHSEPLGVIDHSQGVELLAQELRTRGSTGGPLITLSAQQWHSDVMQQMGPHSMLLLTGCESLTGAEADRLLRLAAQRAIRLLLSFSGHWQSGRDLIGNHSMVELPRLNHRRATVWWVSQRMLARTMGQDTMPAFKPGAVVSWLCAELNTGWTGIGKRVQRLSERVAGAKTVRTRDVQWVLGYQSATNAGRPARLMSRPDKEELSEHLEQGKSVIAIARLYGRTRRQVYRWMANYGLSRTGATKHNNEAP